MNSYDEAPKGHTYTNILVRISTDQGIEGVGAMGDAAPDADGYDFHSGSYTVPDSPGLGIRVNEDVCREKYKAEETVVA